MGNDEPRAAAVREANLYLHLAERFGWTPGDIERIPPHVLSAMALGLAADKQPAEDAPAADEPMAEWERELLVAPGTATAGGVAVGMNFGEALDQLKQGERVFRAGWNGKGMWIVIEDTTRWPNSTMRPFIYMHTADGTLAPWTPSQTDVLAEDWLIRIERAAGTSEPTAPSATTAAQDAGITLTVHLDGKVLYDAIRPHAERARQLDRLHNGPGLR